MKAAAPAPPRVARRVGDPISFSWRRCANHGAAESESICFACRKAFCQACSKMPSHGYVCPECGGFAESSKDEAAAVELAVIRRRPMWPELRTILTYPKVDWLGYIALSFFLGLVGFVPFLGPIIAKGVLMGYCFQALSRVGSGDMGQLLPTSSEAGEWFETYGLAICVTGISLIPLALAILYNAPFTVAEVLKGAATPLQALFTAAALCWRAIYMPAALVVAGQSRSWKATLNPLHGIHVMTKMGAVYWQALLIFLVIYSANGMVSALVQMAHIPILGTFAVAFISSYAFLCIGCALGFAVFKRAPEFA